MIKIGNKFGLGTDSFNVILYEKHIGQKGKSAGKEVWKELAYFSTPQNALDYLVENQVRRTGLEDLKTVCTEINKVKELIRSLDLPAEASISHKKAP